MPTLTINNFKGKLVKNLFGDLNSGLSSLGSNNYGYNPLWNVYEGSLSFMSNVVSTVGGSTLVDPIMSMVARQENNGGGTASDPYVYGLGLNGNFYKVWASDTSTPIANKDTISAYTNNLTASATMNYGGRLIFAKGNLYAGYDSGVSYISAGGTPVADAAWTPVTSTGGLTPSRPRPIVEFLGNVYAGNDNNIAESTDGTTFATKTKLSPAFPTDWVVRDLAVSQDGQYMIIAVSGPVKSLLTLKRDSGNQSVYMIDSAIALWNGKDAGYNSIQFFKGIDISSIAVSNTGTVLFGKDEEGVGIFDLNGNKITSIFDSTESSHNVLNNPAYTPTSNFVFGKKIIFLSQYGTNTYLYCYDMETNSLYPLWLGSLNAETIKGHCILPSYHSSNISGTDLTRAKIYFSLAKLPVATQANNLLYKLHLHNYSGDVSGGGTYSTQIQKFPKKIKLDEIRVFCFPTIANNSFTLTVIGDTGGNVGGAATFSYSYSAGTDLTLAQGSLDCIKFKPQLKELGQMGIQIGSGGTVGMIIHKVEIDYTEVPAPKTAN